MSITSGLARLLSSADDSGVERTAVERPREERVVRLLSKHGGRLWQTDVSAETGWSASKTSEILCRMERRGRITRHQRGRRKVVFLPGEKPQFLDESR